MIVKHISWPQSCVHFHIQYVIPYCFSILSACFLFIYCKNWYVVRDSPWSPITRSQSPEIWFPAPVTCNQDTSQKHAHSSHSLSGRPFAILNYSWLSLLCSWFPRSYIPAKTNHCQHSAKIIEHSLHPHSHLPFAPHSHHSFLSINSWLSTCLLFLAQFMKYVFLCYVNWDLSQHLYIITLLLVLTDSIVLKYKSVC